MGSSTPVVAIPIVDTSASMTSSNYVAITVIDTKAFLSNALPGDYIGVASYDTGGRVTYPTTLVTGVSEPNAAANAVQNLSFMGSCTNMGGGLQTGVNMLAGTPAGMNKGLVLLSDGYQNCGTAPLPLPAGTPAVYSCAMGPNSDQNLMQNIATQSGGTYYYAPYVYNMMVIYNQIRAQTPGSSLLVNQYKNTTPYDFMLIPATVTPGNDLGQFSVVWSDTSYTYTYGQPGLNQISVTLVTPAGVVITPMPNLLGPGYVTFNIPNPQDGLWYIQIEYAGTKPMGLTGGAFEYDPSQNAPQISMKVTAPATIKAGEKIHYSASLMDDSKALPGEHIIASIVKPKISTKNALKAFSHLLKGIVLSEQVADTISKPEIAKLELLRQSNLPDSDIQPHSQHGAVLRQGKDQKYSGTFADTKEAGTYTIKLDVTGYSEKSKSHYSRSQIVSVLVTD